MEESHCKGHQEVVGSKILGLKVSKECKKLGVIREIL